MVLKKHKQKTATLSNSGFLYLVFVRQSSVAQPIFSSFHQVEHHGNHY